MTNLYLDLDGTLLDVSERYYLIYRDIMTTLGQPVLNKAHYWECKRSKLPESQIVGLTTADSSISSYYPEIRKSLLEDPQYLRFDRPVLPNLHLVLADLAKQHCLYLVTLRNNRTALNEQMKDMNLHHYFRAILSPPRASRLGASSWMLKSWLIRDIGWVRQRGTIVGDTEADILAGKELCFRAYAVLSGLRKKDFLAGLSPDALIHDVSELCDQL